MSCDAATNPASPRGAQANRGVSSKLGLSAVLCAVAIGASACGGQGVYALPLPGGADVGTDPMELTAEFADVVDLGDRDDAADLLVHPTLEFVLQQLLDQLRRDVTERFRRYFDRILQFDPFVHLWLSDCQLVSPA